MKEKYEICQEARKIRWRAFDRGVTHFDLANNYDPPPGSAEENVGRILAEDFACHRDAIIELRGATEESR